MTEAASQRNTRHARIAVIGGGAIGLACALELAGRGARVCVYDRASAAAEGVSGRAAGMLGVSFEAGGSPVLYRLMQRSGAAWKEFAIRLETAGGGGDIGYSALPSIFCAMTPTELVRLPSGAFLAPDQIRQIEPAITGQIHKGALLLQDRQVDPILLVERLASILAHAGSEVRVGEPVDGIECGPTFRTPDGGEWDQVLVATGAGQPPMFVRNGDAIDPRLPPIVPVKGQMLALKPWPGAPRHVIRLAETYIVPKARWILVGATEEPGRRDETVEPDVITKLRAKAAEVVGGIATAEQAAVWAGVRPGTQDGLPMIGETAIPGVFAATGHYRNGILLAPETAKIIADAMLDAKVTAADRAFSPLRFDKPVTAPHSR